MLHRDALKTRCLLCKHARLQIKDRNKHELDEYASPAIAAEYLANLDITSVCTATGQQNKMGEVSVCELFESI